MKRKILFSIMVAMLLSSLLVIEKAFAGAWTVPKYKVWAEQYLKWEYGKEEFMSDWKRRTLADGNDARSWDFITESKLEFGITDWLTVLGTVEYKDSHYKDYGRPISWGPYARKNNGISSVKVGGRLRFLENPFVLSTQTRVYIYPGYGNSHGDDPAFTNQPSIGRGDDAVEQRILIGKYFNIPFNEDFKLPCYVNAETGYRWRTRHVCNDIPYFVEGGFWPVNWLLVKSELDGYKTHAGTGSIKESYGIWRIGGVWQVFGGDSILRQGNKMFNIELQYGMVLWGKNTTAFQEWIVKFDTQF